MSFVARLPYNTGWLRDCTVVAKHRALRQLEEEIQYFIATSRYRGEFGSFGCGESQHAGSFFIVGSTKRIEQKLYLGVLKNMPRMGGHVLSLPRTQNIGPLWSSPQWAPWRVQSQ